MKNIIVGAESLDSWHELWFMLHEVCGTTRAEYLQGFDHKYIGNFDLPSLQPGGKLLTVLALGDEVARNLGIGAELIVPLVRDGVVWRQVPHPKNLFYDDPNHRMMVGVLLEELLRDNDQS